jgi:serine protease Do
MTKIMKKINIKYLLASLIILCLLLGSSCLLPSINTSPPTTPTTPIASSWTPPPIEGQAPMLPSIADVVAKVKPSVVAINVKIIVNNPFFGTTVQEGAGSGWIIDGNGIIVTNNHVVEGAESITVTLDDGRTFPVATNTVATDALADLAVLRINAKNLQAVKVGDTGKLRVGDWVVAIGNALGEGISATNGIVSRRDVSISVGAGQTLNNLIQTNAAINPGNSGGPLVNMAGEVIGITSAKLSAVGIEGMGYAISTKEAMPIITQLINGGHVVRPYLGISYSDVNPSLVGQYNLAATEGIFVNQVVPGYPAEKAGLKSGDVIVGFNGKEIANTGDLIQAITSCQVGQRAEIIYWRGNTKNTTAATLTESPPP